MVSVIVPVYNTEKFLQEAINSVLSQNHHDWELILVDDGSTDSSPEICDRAASSCDRIKVIHKTNGGLSSARNAGLDIASGKYITFLDADDLLHSFALTIFTETARKYDADVVCASNVAFEGNSVAESVCRRCNGTVFTPHDAIKEILYQRRIDNSAWGKLYSARLWKDTRFREGTGYEDLDVFYHVFALARTVVSIRNTLYFYRQHPGSYLHRFTPRRADVLTVTARLSGYMALNCQSLLPAAHSRQLSANFNILGLIAANGKTSETAGIADTCWKNIKALRRDMLFNRSVRFKNKAAILVSYLAGRRAMEYILRIIYRRK